MAFIGKLFLTKRLVAGAEPQALRNVREPWLERQYEEQSMSTCKSIPLASHRVWQIVLGCVMSALHVLHRSFARSDTRFAQFLVTSKYVCHEWSKEALSAEEDNRRERELSTRLLFEAVLLGDVQILRAVLEAFPALDMLTPNSRGCTIVHFAARFGHLEILRFCLERYPENVSSILNKRGQYGHTPLLSAVRGGQREVIKDLVDQGANVNAKDSGNGNALHLVMKYKQFHLIPLLVRDLGVSPGHHRHRGPTAIDLAVRKSSIYVLRPLFECGLPESFKALAANWKTHIRIAVERRYPLMLYFLLSVNGQYAAAHDDWYKLVTVQRLAFHVWAWRFNLEDTRFLHYHLGGE